MKWDRPRRQFITTGSIAVGTICTLAGCLELETPDDGADQDGSGSENSSETDADDEVPGQLEVVHSVGTVADTTAGDAVIDEVQLTVKPSAGSGEIDLTTYRIRYTADDRDVSVRHTDGEPTAESFSTERVDTDDAEDDTTLASTDQRLRITIDLDAIHESAPGLQAGSRATVVLEGPSGAQFTHGISVPNTFGDRDVVLV